MAQLAQSQNVTVTDADVDARLDRGRDHPGAAPRVDDRRRPPSSPTARPSSAPRRRRPPRRRPTRRSPTCKAGKDWDDGRQGRCPPTRPRPRAGTSASSTRTPRSTRRSWTPWSRPAPDTPTEVIEGADGIYRIGRVTDIVRAGGRCDATRSRSMTPGSTLPTTGRRSGATSCAPSSATRSSPATSPPSPQREVSEIWHAGGPERVRRGRDQASATSSTRPTATRQAASTVAADRPGVGQGRAGRQGHLREAQGRSRRSSTRIARAESDETSAVTTGGKLPYFSTEDAVDPAFAAAIHAPGLVPGQLLEPVKSAFGWHVIQVMHCPTDLEWAATLKTADRRRDADVRRRRPRQLRQGGRGEGRRHGLGRARASWTRRSRRPSSRRRSARSATRSRSTATASTCSS